ncbi:MAG TPA: pantetheine-phosphate adenylyltransferase [Candidatus Limnocylindrales bacterium]|jgi:pantetheine-phosphate adenylyltransferase
MRVAVYPGSFDPVTFGHLDVIQRAAAVFDRLVVAVLINPRKSSVLTVEERVESTRASIAAVAPDLAGRVEVSSFDGLTVDLCKRVDAHFIVRGLRAVSDFETEMQLAHNNRVLSAEVDTVFFMTAVEHSYVSSSLVREIARFGGDVQTMVPGPAEAALRVGLERVR